MGFDNFHFSRLYYWWRKKFIWPTYYKYFQ